MLRAGRASMAASEYAPESTYRAPEVMNGIDAALSSREAGKY